MDVNCYKVLNIDILGFYKIIIEVFINLKNTAFYSKKF